MQLSTDLCVLIMAFYAGLPTCLPCLCFSSEGHRRNRQSHKLNLGKEGFVFTVHSFHGAPWIGNAIYLIKTESEWFLNKCYSKVDFFFSCIYLYICSTLFSKQQSDHLLHIISPLLYWIFHIVCHGCPNPFYIKETFKNLLFGLCALC